MAIISIDVPAGAAARVADAFIALYPPPAETAVGTNAEKLAYVKSLLVAHVKNVVKSHEVAVAAEAARVAAETAAATGIDLT